MPKNRPVKSKKSVSVVVPTKSKPTPQSQESVKKPILPGPVQARAETIRHHASQVDQFNFSPPVVNAVLLLRVIELLEEIKDGFYKR